MADNKLPATVATACAQAEQAAQTLQRRMDAAAASASSSSSSSTAAPPPKPPSKSVVGASLLAMPRSSEQIGGDVKVKLEPVDHPLPTPAPPRPRRNDPQCASEWLAHQRSLRHSHRDLVDDDAVNREYAVNVAATPDCRVDTCVKLTSFEAMCVTRKGSKITMHSFAKWWHKLCPNCARYKEESHYAWKNVLHTERLLHAIRTHTAEMKQLFEDIPKYEKGEFETKKKSDQEDDQRIGAALCRLETTKNLEIVQHIFECLSIQVDGKLRKTSVERKKDVDAQDGGDDPDDSDYDPDGDDDGDKTEDDDDDDGDSDDEREKLVSIFSNSESAEAVFGLNETLLNQIVERLVQFWEDSRKPSASASSSASSSSSSSSSSSAETPVLPPFDSAVWTELEKRMVSYDGKQLYQFILSDYAEDVGDPRYELVAIRDAFRVRLNDFKVADLAGHFPVPRGLVRDVIVDAFLFALLMNCTSMSTGRPVFAKERQRRYVTDLKSRHMFAKNGLCATKGPNKTADKDDLITGYYCYAVAKFVFMNRPIEGSIHIEQHTEKMKRKNDEIEQMAEVRLSRELDAAIERWAERKKKEEITLAKTENRPANLRFYFEDFHATYGIKPEKDTGLPVLPRSEAGITALLNKLRREEAAAKAAERKVAIKANEAKAKAAAAARDAAVAPQPGICSNAPWRAAANPKSEATQNKEFTALLQYKFISSLRGHTMRLRMSEDKCHSIQFEAPIADPASASSSSSSSSSSSAAPPSRPKIMCFDKPLLLVHAQHGYPVPPKRVLEGRAVQLVYYDSGPAFRQFAMGIEIKGMGNGGGEFFWFCDEKEVALDLSAACDIPAPAPTKKSAVAAAAKRKVGESNEKEESKPAASVASSSSSAVALPPTKRAKTEATPPLPTPIPTPPPPPMRPRPPVSHAPAVPSGTPKPKPKAAVVEVPPVVSSSSVVAPVPVPAPPASISVPVSVSIITVSVPPKPVTTVAAVLQSKGLMSVAPDPIPRPSPRPPPSSASSMVTDLTVDDD